MNLLATYEEGSNHARRVTAAAIRTTIDQQTALGVLHDVEAILERATDARDGVRLVSDLLDFTSARHSGIQLERREHDLHSVVQAALDATLGSWPGRSVQHQRVGDCTLSVDEDRSTQVVANLVGDALQHSPSSSEIFVETRGRPDAVVFSVTKCGDTDLNCAEAVPVCAVATGRRRGRANR
jgi:signal transduction histidine kinase